jgi:hypothetical protein
MLEAVGAEHVALISRHFAVLAAVCEEPGLQHWLEPRGCEVLLHFYGELSTIGLKSNNFNAGFDEKERRQPEAK